MLYYKKIIYILTWIIAIMFVATVLAILHKVAPLRFQYASVYIAREFASAAACKTYIVNILYILICNIFFFVVTCMSKFEKSNRDIGENLSSNVKSVKKTYANLILVNTLHA